MGTSSWRGIVTACVLLGMALVMVFTRLGRGGSAESVDACTLACAHVAACGGCIKNHDGACVSASQCHRNCASEAERRVAMCVAGLSTCDPGAISRCFESLETEPLSGSD
ncbi:MAG: hypothetical protein UY92_C0011G0033 [Candidatus Magasanikbacteria bacterium GW2011_GWA2_56_11]|uniref:Uncharacterized protein n=1 Tax=Candidatus Magasanikbacteria bacterium GW2011_GWA2_56_11 TaxID=1619044 RepID=A0A0G1YFI8_9BACT|nr:MAG: hypothetical protein UY92_C0011G0033 [Candidatus Magasanikbacteria bacterium GW2011_GWA2_56_11]